MRIIIIVKYRENVTNGTLIASFQNITRKPNEMKPQSFKGFNNCTMKNFSLIIGITGMLTLCTSLAKAEVDVTFLPGNLEHVQNLAATEGKLYLVDFVAKWCMPCKWMDETTFSDPAVSNYLRENYIATKVDIDNFDGFNYKNQYNITVLPSILIFNSKGEQVGRYEESMAPSKMMKILAAHNYPENRVVTQAPNIIQNTQPLELETEVVVEVVDQIVETPNFETALEIEEAPVYYEEENIVYEVEEDKFDETSTAQIVDLNLFNMSASPQVREGYSVQIGVFADYGNVLSTSSKMQEVYNQEIIVQVTHLNNKEVFKVMVGDFYSEEEAHELRRLMETNGIPGITKDLSRI